MCMDFKYLSSIIIDISFSGEELRIGSKIFTRIRWISMVERLAPTHCV